MNNADVLPSISEKVDNKDLENASEPVSFEDAMTMAGFGRFHILLSLFCALIMLGMIMETAGIGYIIPTSQCDLELTTSQKGWLAAIPFICVILTMHMWGYLADTRGRKKVLLYTMSIGSFFSIISSFAPDLVSFAALRFIAGIFIAAPSAICYTYLGEMSPLKQRDKMMILASGAVSLGTAVVPIIAWIIIPMDFSIDIGYLATGYRPWRLLVCFCAIPYLLSALLFVYFPESAKFLYNKGDTNEALNILKNIYAINTRKPMQTFSTINIEVVEKSAEDAKKSIIKDIWDQTTPLFRGSYLKYTLLTCFLQFVIFGTTNGFYVWLPTIVDKVLDYYDIAINGTQNMCDILTFSNETSAGPINETISSEKRACNDMLNTGTFSITIILAIVAYSVNVVITIVMKVMDKKYILIVILTITATIALSMDWITHGMVYICLYMLLQMTSCCIGVVNAFVVEIFPTNVRAMAVCITLLVGRCGSVYATNIIAFLIQIMCPMIFFSFTVLLSVSAVASFGLPTKNNSKLK